MSYYDPPEYPSCPNCDGELKQEYPGVRGSDWICVNPECEKSPKYSGEDDESVWCRLCDCHVKKWEMSRQLQDDDRYHYYCTGCDTELLEPESYM